MGCKNVDRQSVACLVEAVNMYSLREICVVITDSLSNSDLVEVDSTLLGACTRCENIFGLRPMIPRVFCTLKLS
jgi:hypothetical protein